VRPAKDVESIEGERGLRPAAAACKNSAVRILLPALIVCAGLWVTAVPALAQRPLETVQTPSTTAQAQKPFVEHIEFYGNQTYPRDMLLARIFTRVGDPYDPEALRRDFHALWNTGYFSDIQLIVQDDPQVKNGKIVIFYVTERPVIRLIKYAGNHSVQESDILDAYKHAKVHLSVEDRFDPTKVKRAVVVIKALLAAHGRQFATVKPAYTKIPAANAVILTFNINEGPKVKVGKITIQGNHAFNSEKIVRSMKNTRPYAIPLYFFDIPVMSKTYDEGKLDEDMATGVQALYQDNGYFRVLVKDPAMKTVDVHRPGIPWIPIPWIGAVHGKATNITIPIEEGSQYKLGKLFIRSSDPEKGLFFKQAYLKEVFPLKQGDIFDAGKVRDSFKNYTKLYGAWGFVDFTATPQFDINEKSKVINLTLVFDEEKQYYVRRIDFSGNTTTRDKVIRRELLINEGDLFNSHLWELSLLRLNQLGYFDQIKPESADIKRNSTQGTVDILLKVHEKGKQSIGLTGGVSGLAGTFIGLNYQTNNFLGLGETLTFEADVGSVQRNIVFGFTEPYLLGRPISTGFTVFSTYYAYDQARETSLLLGQQVNIPGNIAQNYNISSSGFTLFASSPIRRFSFARLGMNYSYTRSNITAFSSASTALFQAVQFRGFAGPSQLQGIVASQFMPTITYSTVNDTLNPTGGKYFFAGMGYEGLGGNVNALLPSFEMKYFHPINHHRNVLAFHLQTSFGTGYAGQVLPPYNRFFTGGEQSVRGFDFYAISPWAFLPSLESSTVSYFDPTVLGPSGQPTQRSVTVPVLHYIATRPGGDTMGFANFEYRIPLVGNYVGMDFFYDVGIDGVLLRNQLEMSTTALSALRLDFPNPDFPNAVVPSQLSLAPGTNFKLHSSTGIEFVVQLPIVHAPFRVYYAYNPNRFSGTIVEPTGAYFLSPASKNALPPHVLQSQVLPQLNALLVAEPGHYASFLFEPVHTIRFTVSRTF
jgi:outer membrane protein insertion porin family